MSGKLAKLGVALSFVLLLAITFQVGTIVGEMKMEEARASALERDQVDLGGRSSSRSRSRSKSLSEFDLNSSVDRDLAAFAHTLEQFAAVGSASKGAQETLLETTDMREEEEGVQQVSSPFPDEADRKEGTSSAPSQQKRWHRRPTRAPPRPPAKRKGGRDGADDSHVGLVADPVDYMYHAWNYTDRRQCHGTRPRADCVDREAVEWFRKHVLLSVISGKEGAFRVEISQCSWLSHFPPENVFVFSDRVPMEGKDRTPHTWVEGRLPDAVWEKDGDLFSKFIPEGYLHKVRSAGQGYSAGWVEAQFRFVQALEHMMHVNKLQKRGQLKDLVVNGAGVGSSFGGNKSHEGEGGDAEVGPASALLSPVVAVDKNAVKRAGHRDLDYKWFMIIDDDTVVNINHLVARLKQVSNPNIPWYLSRKGWGGAGHLFNLMALNKMEGILPQCFESYMLKSFRASDAMLLKCAGAAKLALQKEQSMSHCPASNIGARGMVSPSQVTFHGKKDFYPPVLLATWRVYLYYVASYCLDTKAGFLATEWSACAFGSCKANGCTKEKNERMRKEWLAITDEGRADLVPLHLMGA